MSRTLPTSKIRWDRKFRAVMVVVFALVGWIGLRATVSLISTHAAANQERQVVSTLANSNHKLEAEIDSLKQRSTIIRDARELGYVKTGERAYSVVGMGQGN